VNALAKDSSAHISVLLAECVAGLALRPDGSYLDGTYGRGGHARAIMQQLGPAARLCVVDRDPQAIADANAWAATDSRVQVCHGTFADVIEQCEPASLDGVLLDLGVSSPQLDDAERGFSFQSDGPLDMRMDPSRGLSAAEWLAQIDEVELTQVLRDYGEEPEAKFIARAVVQARGTLHRTQDLAQLVQKVKRQRKPGRHAATQVFQALRIALNDELQQVQRGLNACLRALKAGARLVVIAFHSLEDRIVKSFIKIHAQAPSNSRRDLMGLANAGFKAQLQGIGKAQFASEAECASNPRSRSAVLRIAERLA
jgi:16S rRNA (cytosine1402-N4)-methyltransferase